MRASYCERNVGLQQTAQRLIASNGRNVTLRRKSLTPIDPAAPWDANLTYTESTIKTVMLDFGTEEVDGSLVKATDRKALISPLDATTIGAQDEIVDRGVRYAVLNVVPVEPGEVNYLWKLQLRA